MRGRDRSMQIPREFLNLYSYKAWLALTISVPLVCALALLLLAVTHDQSKISAVIAISGFLSKNHTVFSLLFIGVIVLLAVKLPISLGSDEVSEDGKRKFYVMFRLFAFFLWYISVYVLLFQGISQLGPDIGLASLGDSGIHLAQTFAFSIGIVILLVLRILMRQPAD